MQGHFLGHFWLQFGVKFGAIWGAKCATILILGALGLDFGTLLLHLIFHRLFDAFWGPAGGRGGMGGCYYQGEGSQAYAF